MKSTKNVLTCANPSCYTHQKGRNWTFSLSTAMDEKKYCSLACENLMEGGAIVTETKRK